MNEPHGQTERERLSEPTTNEPGSAGVDRRETIADHVDLGWVDHELPAGWNVRPDIVQPESPAEPLAETLLFRRSLADPQLVLRPADLERPGEETELHERSGPRATSERTMTIDRLPEAVRVAVNRVHQFDG